MSEPEDKTEAELEAERELDRKVEAGDFDHIFFSSADWLEE